MSFKIKKTVSNKSWGEINKSDIWQRLKTGLQEGTEGVVEAVREMYAVVKANINKDLTQADCWGPHHEMQQDSSLVLNRGGVIAAVAALQGARAKPTLTPEQKAQAEAHLKRHYTELELSWPSGEIILLQATLTGEMAVEDVPLSPGVDLAALKAGDSDPFEVVVEISSGKSTKGWDYLPSTLQKMAQQVMTRTVAGFLGHQKTEDLEYQFPIPVTHWVGAAYKNGKIYVRGVVDKAADDLKRWIKAGRIKQVSIYGIASLQEVKGETQVVDFDLMSIDWTPLDRNGMSTRIVASGEIDSIITHGGAKILTVTELVAELKKLDVNPKKLFSEMGWKFEDVAGEIGGETWVRLQGAAKAVGEMTELFGLSKEAKLADLVVAVKAAREVQTKAVAAEQEKLVDKVIGEMVVVEAARPLVKRMLQVPAGMDETAVRKAVGEMLEEDGVKKALAGVFKDTVIIPKVGREINQTSNLRIKRTAI